MGLRLREGVDAGRIAERFGISYRDRLGSRRSPRRLGPSRRDGTHIALTPRGRLLLDHILGEIAAVPSLGFVRLASPTQADRLRGRRYRWP